MKIKQGNDDEIFLLFGYFPVFYYLKEIILADNHLAELNGLTNDAYPNLEKLDITKGVNRTQVCPSVRP